jgi:catechol 2,3-dioxygenase-like lactoylglutathione lyase family enzyme
MKPSGIHHVAIHARGAGVEAVTAFYRDVLGLPELQRHLEPSGALRSVWLSLGTSFLAVEAGDTFGPAMIALRIERKDRGGVLQELGRRGVPVQKQSKWTIYVDDPAGNHVGLSHHPDDA